MQPTLIAVGIGNTSIQVGTASDARYPPTWLSRLDLSTSTFRPEQLQSQLPVSRCCWRIASVHRASEAKLAAWVRETRERDRYLALAHHDLPLRVNVDRPEHVGVDRLAAVVGANHLRQESRPAIVVDAGTAITVDLVGSDGAFKGGAILAGIQIVARALATGTDLLPEVIARFGEDPPVVGTSTEAAIRSGLMWGAVGATRELIRKMSLDLGQPAQLFVTGGDAEQLAAHLGNQARYVPDLVLAGIVASAKGCVDSA